MFSWQAVANYFNLQHKGPKYNDPGLTEAVIFRTNKSLCSRNLLAELNDVAEQEGKPDGEELVFVYKREKDEGQCPTLDIFLSCYGIDDCIIYHTAGYGRMPCLE